jgi:hypothetical protein
MQAFSSTKELAECYLDLKKKKPNVVGIDGDLQLKIKDGKILKDVFAIRVYVKEKIPLSDFKDSGNWFSKSKRKIFHTHSFFKEDLIPTMINGTPVDVVEIGNVHALTECASQTVDAPRPIKPRSTTKLKYRPLQAGISATHYQSTACTLNGLWREKSTGKLLIASNNHCFGRENNAKPGDAILQPSPYDGGIYPDDKVGEFYKCVEIRFVEFKSRVRNFFHGFYRKMRTHELFFNRVDIAFATLGCSKLCQKNCDPIKLKCAAKIYGIGLPIGKRLPDLNQKVQKIGRTTGKTIGTVVSTSWTGTVRYSRGTATFIDCILISGKNFSLGGDSGSPVLDMNGNYIGALFAGSADHSIICKWNNIEAEAGVELVLIKDNKKIMRRN